eukprot:1340738-Amorphochlora_amoeboformis.AAC.1
MVTFHSPPDKVVIISFRALIFVGRGGGKSKKSTVVASPVARQVPAGRRRGAIMWLRDVTVNHAEAQREVVTSHD